MAFQGQFSTGMASALAYIMLIVIIGVSNVYIRYLNRIEGGITMASHVSAQRHALPKLGHARRWLTPCG